MQPGLVPSEGSGMVPTMVHTAATGTRWCGSWRRFRIRWPAKRLAVDDAVDDGLVPNEARAVLGSGADDDKDISLLNRLVRWNLAPSRLRQFQTPLACHGALRFGGGAQRAHGACHQGRRWRRRR